LKGHIVFIDETASLGGGEINLLRIAASVREFGWQPVVLVASEGPLLGLLDQQGIEGRVVRGGPFRSLSLQSASGVKVPDPLAWPQVFNAGLTWSARLAEELADLNPSVVQTCSMLSHLFGGWKASRLGNPVVAHVQDIVSARSGLGLYRKVFRGWARRFPQVLACISPLVADQFEHEREAESRIRVIWNMVDFPARETQRPWLVSGDSPPLRLGTSARLTPWKGHLVALQTARELKTAGVPFVWRFAGDESLGLSTYATSLNAKIDEWDLRGDVELLGWMEDMEEFFESIDILVHVPTEPEPFGLVVAEAMARGIPVICSRGGGLESVVEREGGVLVPRGDPLATSRAIADMGASFEGIVERCAQAVPRVRRLFAPEVVAPQWNALYEEVTQ